MATLALRLDDAIDKGNLNASEVGRVVGASGRTVVRWTKDEAEPRPIVRERLLELLVVVDRLSKTLVPQAAHDWLFSPNPSLAYRKPAEMLKDGDYRDVLGAIDALGEGAFA